MLMSGLPGPPAAGAFGRDERRRPPQPAPCTTCAWAAPCISNDDDDEDDNDDDQDDDDNDDNDNDDEDDDDWSTPEEVEVVTWWVCAGPPCIGEEVRTDEVGILCAGSGEK
mmetsp:Transcript_85243/g.221817  ORF Transcript_85243/g.221817 Transcript_85243/m.221817 type:complete len:111 (+) Transcript_85243:1289-1621(+)